MAAPSGRYCYHFNGTASTIAITDMNQNLVNSYAYDPFGQILAQQETIPQPFMYVGQYGVMAEPNGLYYMRARYYDPNVGRFISEDPLGFGGGDVNLYAYVQNNPVNRVDPRGLQAFPAPFPGIPLPLPPLFIPGTPENQAFVKSFQQILRNIQFRDSADESDCDQEWEDAYQICGEELSKSNPCKGITGGYPNIHDCARGHVSERCGGNKVVW